MVPFRSFLLFMACLIGAGGVAAAAVASHGPTEGNRMSAAAQIMLAHSAASLALVAAVPAGWITTAGIALIELGTILFSADMASRTYSGSALFSMAAPTGGWLIIAGWLVAGAAVLLPGRP